MGDQSSPAEHEVRAYSGGALSDRFDQYTIREFLAQATNSENEKSPGYFLIKKLHCTRIDPLHLDKDLLEQFSHRSGLANGRGLGGGSWREGKRISVLQSVGWIQPALAAAKAGHYQVGIYWIAWDKQQHALLRTPEFLLVVSQKVSRRARTYPQGQCGPGYRADPSISTGWWKQTAGYAILALHKDRQVYPVFLEHGISPQDCIYYLNRGKGSGFTSCMAVYIITQVPFAQRLPPMPLLELCLSELKRHTNTQASITDTLHR